VANGTQQNKHDKNVRKLNYLNEKRNKKNNAGGTTTLTRNKFKYTTETKKVVFLNGKKLLLVVKSVRLH